MRITSGLQAKARAMATRCVSPPESLWAIACLNISIPTRASSSPTILSRFAFGVLRIFKGNSTFLETVVEKRMGCCWTSTTFLRSAIRLPRVKFTFSESNQMSPEFGLARKAKISKSVVLPAPLGPRSARTLFLSRQSLSKSSTVR